MPRTQNNHATQNVNGLYLALYMSGASVGRHETDIIVQKALEVEEVLDRYGCSGQAFVSTIENTSPTYKVETALANGHWEDAWNVDGAPTRFASKWQARKDIKEHLHDLHAAGMEGSPDDFRIEPTSDNTYLEISFAADPSSLTTILAEKLSNDRSPANSPSGSVNIIRDMMEAHPDLDPDRIKNVVDAFVGRNDNPDLVGAAIISVATIILDGDSTKLDAAINDLANQFVRSTVVRDKAKALEAVIETINDSMTPEGMIEAIKADPESPAPQPDNTVQPTARPHSPSP